MVGFQFDSMAAFLSMGGHGPYVWASYGITLALLVWLLVSPMRRQQKLIKNLKKAAQSVKSKKERSS